MRKKGRKPHPSSDDGYGVNEDDQTCTKSRSGNFTSRLQKALRQISAEILTPGLVSSGQNSRTALMNTLEALANAHAKADAAGLICQLVVADDAINIGAFGKKVVIPQRGGIADYR